MSFFFFYTIPLPILFFHRFVSVIATFKIIASLNPCIVVTNPFLIPHHFPFLSYKSHSLVLTLSSLCHNNKVCILYPSKGWSLPLSLLLVQIYCLLHYNSSPSLFRGSISLRWLRNDTNWLRIHWMHHWRTHRMRHVEVIGCNRVSWE